MFEINCILSHSCFSCLVDAFFVTLLPLYITVVYFVEVDFVVCGFGIKFEPGHVDFLRFCG